MAGDVFGNAVLAFVRNPSVARVARGSPLTRSLVERFVAGETLDSALEVVGRLEARGLRASLDHLGENTATEADAGAAVDEALRALERMSAARPDAYISVKLTQLGLDVGEHVALDNARQLLARAEACGGFIRLDMEGSDYTGRTIDLFTELRGRFECVGIVLQACLYRTERDVRELIALGARIRLCKGAYSEPPHIAFRRKRDTDRNYVRLMETLLLHGCSPAIATHDVAIIGHARSFARQHGIGPERFEFQMLYGVRRDVQDDLVRAGYTVRVYVPYGTEWYPYLSRRLAERPANLVFVAGSIARERRASSQ